MLEIFVENKKLTLFGDTNIPGVFNNPFFNGDGSFSFDVEIPSKPNGLIFDFPENPGSRSYRQRNYTARVEHYGQTFFCRCRLSEATDTEYALNFYFEESAFYNRLKNLRLDNIDYKERFSIDAPQIATAASHTDGEILEIGKESNYQHLIKNLEIVRNPSGGLSHYAYSIGPYNQVEYLDYLIKSPEDSYPYTVHFAVMINADYYPEGENHLVFNIVTYSKPGHALQKNHLRKRINPALNQIFHAAITVSEDTSVQFLVSWNNPLYYNANWYLNSHNVTVFETFPGITYPDPSAKKYSFFPTKYLYYSQEGYVGPILNNNDLANYCYGRLLNNFVWIASNTDYNFQEVFLGKLFPSFFVKHILDALFDITGYKFIIPAEITDINNIVLVGQVNLVNPEYFLDPRKELYRANFTPNEVLPWVSLAEFVVNMAKATGTYPVINDIEQTFEFRPFTQTILSREYVDISNLVSEKKINYPVIPEGFRINQKNHPDPYFKRKHPTLEGKNLRPAVELLSDLPESGNQLNDVILVTARAQYFEWSGTRWDVFADYPEMELFHNVNQENIFEYDAGGMYPLISRTAFRPLLSNDSLLCPITELPVHNIITDEPSSRQNLKLVFSIYRGMQYYMLNDVEYPLLSHARENVRGFTIADTDFSASIVGTDGLYMKRLKDYIFIFTNDPVMVRATVNPTSLLIFPKQKVMIDGVKYLVEQAEWAFLPAGISPISCLLRKINN